MSKILKRPETATAEELLKDLTSYEDLDSALIVTTTRDGGVFIMPYEFSGHASGEGKTFKEALLNFGRAAYEPWWNEENFTFEFDWGPK